MHIAPRRGLVPASVLATLALGQVALAGIVADATILAHRDRQTELTTRSRDIVAQADSEGRDLTAEELETIRQNDAEVERLEAQITARQQVTARWAALGQEQPRRTTPTGPTAQGAAAEAAPQQPATRPSVPAAPQNARHAGTAGFRNFGEFANAVRHAATQGGVTDARLVNAAMSTFGSEGIGADGGFAVPPDFASDIMGRVFAEDSLVARADLQTSSSNSWTAPTDETTRWGTGGVKAFWTAEAREINQSKPSLRTVTIRLEKLSCLVPATDELLEDAPAMDRYLRSRMPEAIDWEISNAMVRGTGAGQPLGILNSPALVVQAIESGQAANTFVVANAAKMYARMPVRSRQTAVWLIHPELEPLLFTMTLGDTPVYLPPGGVADRPYGTLFGRPVIPHQAASALSSRGDVMFVDWSQYLAVGKAGGIRVQTSIHLWFDQDATAFKATLRLGGQPWWSSPQTNAQGSGQLSPYVTLANR